MKRNWFALILAIVALASCSVEKRVYQPGYHIEWNHYASQDKFQDVSQGRSEEASQDKFQDVSQGRSQGASQEKFQDVSQGRSEGASQGFHENFEISSSQYLPQDLSENLFQDATQDVSQGRSEEASQDLPQDLSKNLETDVSQGLSKNLETDVSQATGQAKHSDLEFVLLIILALFLPALTIFLVEGFSKNFWIALLLMAVAYLLPFSSFFVRGLIVAIATILAIAVVFHYM